MEEGGVEALRALREACPTLLDFWPEDVEPAEWTGVKMNQGRAIELKLETSPGKPMLTLPSELPAQIGRLTALRSIELHAIKQLTALSPQVGKLDGLVTLSLRQCQQLTGLPAEIGCLVKLETLDVSSCTMLAFIPPEISKMQNLRALKMSKCLSIETLPAGIGSLGSLKTLRLDQCLKLQDLPLEFGMLTALTTLNLDKCRALKESAVADFVPPDNMKGPPAEEIVGYLAAHLVLRASHHFARPVEAWLDRQPHAVNFFLTKIITNEANAEGVSLAVAAHPRLAELTNKEGRSAVELACAACKASIEEALYLLGRFEVDPGPPLYASSSCTVLAARDRESSGALLGSPAPRKSSVAAQKASSERLALKLIKDEATVLAELKGRMDLENGVAMPILGVYACTSAPSGPDSLEKVYDGKVPILREESLHTKVCSLLKSRLAPIGGGQASGACSGFKYVLMMRVAETNLASLVSTVTADLPCLRKVCGDIAKTLSKLHSKKRIHASLTPRHIVLVGNTWQLLDLGVSVRLSRPFGPHKLPCTGFCPPEMARVVLKALSVDTGGGGTATKREGGSGAANARVKLSELKTYNRASIAYDLWSFGCVLFHLVFGAPLWRVRQDDNLADPADLERLANWSPFDRDEVLEGALSTVAAASSPIRSELHAAVDLLRKLLEPSEVDRVEHFQSEGGANLELRAVLKHPFLSGADHSAVAATVAAALEAAAHARAERQRMAEEAERTAKAASEARDARLARLETDAEALRAEVESRMARIKELEISSSSLTHQLESSKAQLVAERDATKVRFFGLEQRDAMLRAERERIRGVLQPALEASLSESEGMFGQAAKERAAMLQEALAQFETQLPEVEVGDATAPGGDAVAQGESGSVQPTIETAPPMNNIAMPPVPPPASTLGANGAMSSEELHLNELTEKLDASEALVASLQGKQRAQAQDLEAKAARASALENKVAELEAKLAHAASTPRKGKKGKQDSKHDTKLSMAHATADDSASSHRSPSSNRSARSKGNADAVPQADKPTRMSIKDRMAMFNK